MDCRWDICCDALVGCLCCFLQAHELNDAQTHTFNTWSLVLMVGR
jgi:hypothetical protein